MRRIIYATPTTLLLLLLLCAAAVAAEAISAEDMMETRVTAESMNYSPSGHEVEFSGDVHVAREDMNIWADSITVGFAPDGKNAKTAGGPDNLDPGAIRSIVARGSVRIEREGRIGRSDQASYDVNRGVLELSGDPVLEDGQNRIEGKVIRFYLKDNRSEVVGDASKRVEALFFTPKGFKE